MSWDEFFRFQSLEERGLAGIRVAFGEQAVEPLRRALARGTVSDALVEFRLRGIVERLINALGHPIPLVRAQIVAALALIGAWRATPHIIRLLADEDENVRCEAADALGYLGDPSAVPDILVALEVAFESPANGFWVRRSAAGSLLMLGWSPKTRNQEILVAVLDFAGRLHSRRSDPERVAPVTRYGASAVEYLLMALETGNRSVRRMAAEALGEIGDERARDALVRAAKRTPSSSYADREVRDAARCALKKLGSPADREVQ